MKQKLVLRDKLQPALLFNRSSMRTNDRFYRQFIVQVGMVLALVHERRSTQLSIAFYKQFSSNVSSLPAVFVLSTHTIFILCMSLGDHLYRRGSSWVFLFLPLASNLSVNLVQCSINLSRQICSVSRIAVPFCSQALQ